MVARCVVRRRVEPLLFDLLLDCEDLDARPLYLKGANRYEHSFEVAHRAALHRCFFGRSSRHHHACPTGNAFRATDGTKAFGSATGHGDWRCAGCAEIALHFFSHWRDLWKFADNRDRCISDRPSE